MNQRRYHAALTVAAVLAASTPAHADKQPDNAFVSLMLLSGDFGNEGFSYSPPLNLHLMHGPWRLDASGYHAWTNSDAKLVKGMLPRGWGYSLGLSYTTSIYEEDVHVVSTHSEVISSQYIMGVGTLNTVRYYTTDAGIEHRVNAQAVRFGISGGRKQREFTPLLDKIEEDGGSLTVRTVGGLDTRPDAAGGLYGTATQHNAYAGYEYVMLVPPIVAMKGYVDLQFLLTETIGDELGTMSDIYLATAATRASLKPGLLGRFGFRAGWEVVIGYLHANFAFGVEPGTGGGIAQVQAGPAFSF